MLHGGLTTSERQDVLQQFVTGDARLLLATDAASEGLNLHHRCRLVINLELPWTPVRLEQRIGRVERLGQTRRVHAVHLLAAGTCEEESVAVLLARMRHVAGVLGGMRAEPSTASSGSLPRSASDESKTSAYTMRASVASRAWSSAICARPREKRRRASNEPAPWLRALTCIHQMAGRVSRCSRLVARRSTTTGSYRLSFEDADSQPIWDERDRDPRRGERGSSHEPRPPALARVIRSPRRAGAHIGLARAAVVAAVHAPRTTVSRHPARTAIAEELEQQRARLASALVQPGLFDRRAERAAAAQNATLDEALAPLRASARRARQEGSDLVRSTASDPRRDPSMIPGVRGGLISASFARDVLPSLPETVPVPPAIAAKLASWSRRLEATLGTAVERARDHGCRGPAAAQPARPVSRAAHRRRRPVRASR